MEEKQVDTCPAPYCASSAVQACQQMSLSAWAYRRVLKLARTIEDLAGSERIQPAHIAEAIHLRSAATDRIVE